ncbi:MAG: hypothetical protein ABIE70_11135 [bacterium]
MHALQYVTIGAVAVALVAMIIKALRYAKAPEGMRWELYPVPHEKGRAEYGGSYLEELDWWTKPRQTDRLNELKEMLSEIILLKGVFHHNKRVWISSFPFHLGMYFSIAWLALLLVGAIMHQMGMPVAAEASGLGLLVHFLTIPLGYAALILSCVGAAGLCLWRATDNNQRRYNAPIDYFNLLAVMVATGVAAVAQFTADPGFVGLRGFVGATITFDSYIVPSMLVGLEIALVAFVIAWIPLTRMSHFVAKYFLYHSIRWNDEPNERGSKLEAGLIKQLAQTVTWAAPHIQTGKTWGEVVTEVKTDE